jgi:hypothetical protein
MVKHEEIQEPSFNGKLCITRPCHAHRKADYALKLHCKRPLYDINVPPHAATETLNAYLARFGPISWQLLSELLLELALAQLVGHGGDLKIRTCYYSAAVSCSPALATTPRTPYF